MTRLQQLVALSLAIAAAGAGPPGPQAPGQAAAAPERPADVKAIHELGAAFVRAYEKGDAKAIAALFTEDAEVTNDKGAAVRGREAIGDLFAAAFESSPGEKIEINAETLRFLGPDVARETGVSRTIPAKGGPPEMTRYRALLVRRDGRWLHATVDESAGPPPTPHERLKELEWLLGDWVDESDQGVVHTTCRWSDDKNFLVREFTLRFRGRPVMTGSQRIGWDPLTDQFKSWVFDHDGGHSEGRWSRSGQNQWVIHASGVLADGRVASGTQVLTYVSRGHVRWRSVDRTVDGHAQPDLPEVVIVRAPPKPGAAAAK